MAASPRTRAAPSAPMVSILCLTWIVLGACAHNLTQDPFQRTPPSDAQDPLDGMRFATMDGAALAAAEEIRRRIRNGTRPVEWSFNIFRDGDGYFLGAFSTDHRPFSVSVRIEGAAVAAGHNHTRSSELDVCSATPEGCPYPDTLSKWDRGKNGVLRVPERAQRFLPHYLVTPSRRLRVWEWQGPERRWAPRWVHRTTDP